MEYKELFVIVEENAGITLPETVADREKQLSEAEKSINRGFLRIFLSVLLLVGLAGGAVVYGSSMIRYHNAIELLESNDFARAKVQFEELGDFRDASEMVREAEKGFLYLDAMHLLDQGKREEAQGLLEEIGDFRDAPVLLKNIINQLGYERAIENMAKKNYQAAYEDFSQLGDYQDAREKATECLRLDHLETTYREGCKLYKDCRWGEAYRLLSTIRDDDFKETARLLREIPQLSEEYARKYAQSNERGRTLAFLRVLEEIDPEKGSALRAELIPEESFEQEKSFYIFDTSHIERMTFNTPKEDFASVLLYMLLHGQSNYALMAQSSFDRGTMEERVFSGLNMTGEILPGYSSIYNPAILVGDNYVTIELKYEEKYNSHQRNQHIKTFKAFCEDSVQKLAEAGLISESMSRKQRAEVILNWVTYFLTYDRSLEIHDVGVAIEEKKGVCESYAALYSRMCNLAGVPTYGQMGMAGNGQTAAGHIWSFHVDEKGLIFYSDATWADSCDIDFSKDDQEEPTIERFIEYYLDRCMKKTLSDMKHPDYPYLYITESTQYQWSANLWNTHHAERTPEEIIAYHNKITGRAA